MADTKRGLIKDDSVTFEVHVEADEPKGVYEFDCPKQYVAAEGTVSLEHAFMMNSVFMGEQKEHGCLRVGENLVMFHVNDFWVDAKKTAGKKGQNMTQLGLKLSTPLVLHAVRLGQEGQMGEIQYLATAVWKRDLEDFKDPDKRPKPKGPDKICKILKGVFDHTAFMNIKHMTYQLKGKQKREYRQALRLLKSKDDQQLSKEVGEQKTNKKEHKAHVGTGTQFNRKTLICVIA